MLDKKEDSKSINEAKKEIEDFKRRLQKSRGLRKLMTKRAKERLEILRVNFYKFYRAGIYSQFRSVKKRRNTCVFIPTTNFLTALSKDDNLADNRLSLMNTKNLKAKEFKEKEELKTKMNNILGKIIFKADRRNMIIMKKIFEQFYLKTKLEAVTSIITNDKEKNKKKKKSKKKSKSLKEKKKDNNEDGKNNEEKKEEE